jgi:hypothetical protein
MLDSLRESRISLWRPWSIWRPWSLAALVDATSRVSDNCRVKRFSENTPMTMPERLNDTEREKADGQIANVRCRRFPETIQDGPEFLRVSLASLPSHLREFFQDHFKSIGLILRKLDE